MLLYAVWTDDCYFSLTNITGFNASSRKKITYPNLRSAMRPVPHSDDLPVPSPLVNKDLLSSSVEEMPSREDSGESISFGRYWVYIFRNKWQWATLDHARRPEWSCLWFVSVKTAVRALSFSAKTVEPSPGRCKDHQFQELEQIRSLVFLWVCKQASQSTVVFSVSGIVELYPRITSRKTGGLEALLFLANTASRRILWWTWIRCFFLLFTSSLV